MGGGGAQRPVLRDNESQKTGARSARARTRGQNPLVNHIFTWGPLSVIFLSVILSSCHNCGTLCYSFSFNNQTDSGDEREGFEREGLEMER